MDLNVIDSNMRRYLSAEAQRASRQGIVMGKIMHSSIRLPSLHFLRKHIEPTPSIDER